ncbi:MAG: hypothetical protein GC185_06645 [Alphaproteobacteria bacterium]|nr:hypothetical protein [Alphaproteobacteria bacterium]
MSGMDHLTEEQLALEYLRKTTRERQEFFGNKGKEERERISVKEFLSLLKIDFADQDICSLEQNSKTDVQFHDASFQVKELMDENFRRSEFHGNARRAAEKAKSIREVSWNLKAYDVPSPAKLYDLIVEFTGKLDSKYTKLERSKLDLLIYATRGYASCIREQEIQISDFDELGWRSVLCVNSKQAVILYSSVNSPEFIRNHFKKIFWSNTATDN